ncbi:MAG TPA: HAD-IA family hydrolase [Coriobacteriia bacterium]|nr:HAD-IA family hydrolase [Coriobacteriia bacterium]
MGEAGLRHRVRVVLFDLDGTLIDTVALILSSFRHATAEVLGAPLPDDVLMRNVGVPLANQMREIAPEHAEELLRVYREHNARHHDEMIAEYPGTRETLVELAGRGYRMGVVTSKGTPMARRGLEALGLGGYFEVLVTADDVNRHKPDPHPLLHAAKLMAVPPKECAYVGDSPHDMVAARAAGAVAVAALWGAFEPHVLMGPGPEYALRSIDELPTVLENMAAPTGMHPAGGG